MKSSRPSNSQTSPVWLACALLFVILGILFAKSFFADYIFFSNDGPLGMQQSAWLKLPQGFTGQWDDLNSIGWSGGASWLDVAAVIRWGLGPLYYAKFLVPISLWILGFGAYFFMRRTGFASIACILGGLAAALTTNFFSDGCWGAGPAVIAFGMDFLALGALAKRDERPLFKFFVCPALAGLGVGLNVMEATDIGALFSVLIATYAVYQALTQGNGPIPARAAGGIIQAFVVAVFAVFIAAYAISELVGTNINGISGTQQDTQTKAMKWDFASQWSLPKRETLSLIIPGLFGDRVDFRDEKAYWGGMGRDSSWDRFYGQELKAGDSLSLIPPGQEQGATVTIDSGGNLTLPSIAPIHAAGMTRFEVQKKINELGANTRLKGTAVDYGQGFARHTGRGFYFGLLVVIMALWASFQSFRKDNSVFTLRERKMIWFWLVAAIISLLIAHGKFSPFNGIYFELYTTLPYLSTVRSPEKFLHATNLAVIVLFGYGIHGLNRRYFEGPFIAAGLSSRLKSWWARAAAFDKRWVAGSFVALVVAAVGLMAYLISRGALEQYLQDMQFDPELSRAIASYSILQVAWFVLFLALDCGLLLLIFSGAFAGRRAVWGGVLLGVLLVTDLARADWPYRIFWNYTVKYETSGLDPVVKFLDDKPYEHRVAELPFRVPPQFAYFHELYQIEWVQQLFPYYNVQSLDIAQLARMPQDLEAYERSFQFPGTPPLTRRWQLTNTRYLLGPAGYLEVMNQQVDPALKRFRLVANFKLAPKAGIEQTSLLADLTALPSPQGEYGLFEFSGALPRAKLYSNWEANTPAEISGFTTNGLDDNQLRVANILAGTNGYLTLKKLVSPAFDPSQTVLLDKPIAATPANATTNQNPGTVEYTSYAATDIKLKANATTPSVLLLNDRYDPTWQVWVDDKPSEVLRANFIMRGVFVPAGQHEIEFRFLKPMKMFYMNIAAAVVGLGLLGLVIVSRPKQPEVEPGTTKPNSK